MRSHHILARRSPLPALPASPTTHNVRKRQHHFLLHLNTAHCPATPRAPSLLLPNPCPYHTTCPIRQAFVDFFNLTHSRPPQPPPPNADPDAAAAAAAAAQEDVPQEALGLLRTELLKADNALRAGDTQGVYTAYKNLAKYFAQLGRLQKAEFFFRRCLRLSQDTQWLAGELEANLALGVVYEELHETEAAIECYERRLQLASDNQLQTEKDTAYQNLTTVYLRQAEVQESSGQLELAIGSYNKCLSAAERSGDNPTAAKANFKIGMLYHEQRKFPEAIHYLRQFIEVSGYMADRAAVGSAYTTFAGCLKAMGDREAAVRCLEEYLQVGKGAGSVFGLIWFGSLPPPVGVSYHTWRSSCRWVGGRGVGMWGPREGAVGG